MTIEDREAGTPDGDRSRSSSASSKKPRKPLPLWQETILLLFVALGLAILIKAFFVQAFYIPSPSMEPGLVKNDRILVQKVSYWTGDPQRGDVVVFKDPGGWLSGPEAEGPSNPIAQVMTRIGLYPAGGHLVKRVIGVAGDTVSCCDKQGRISVNDQPLDETGYVKKDPSAPCNGPMIGCRWTTGPVPEGHVFVMGDNRFHSADSTVHMCREGQTECQPGSEFVSSDLVVGKVFVLLWPSSRFRMVERPEGFDAVPAPTQSPSP